MALSVEGVTLALPSTTLAALGTMPATEMAVPHSSTSAVTVWLVLTQIEALSPTATA